jgi:hypothetical protein
MIYKNTSVPGAAHLVLALCATWLPMGCTFSNPDAAGMNPVHVRWEHDSFVLTQADGVDREIGRLLMWLAANQGTKCLGATDLTSGADFVLRLAVFRPTGHGLPRLTGPTGGRGGAAISDELYDVYYLWAQGGRLSGTSCVRGSGDVIVEGQSDADKVWPEMMRMAQTAYHEVTSRGSTTLISGYSRQTSFHTLVIGLWSGDLCGGSTRDVEGRRLQLPADVVGALCRIKDAISNGETDGEARSRE